MNRLVALSNALGLPHVRELQAMGEGKSLEDMCNDFGYKAIYTLRNLIDLMAILRAEICNFGLTWC